MVVRIKRAPAATRGVGINTFNIGLNRDQMNTGKATFPITCHKLRAEMAKVVEDEPAFICFQEVSPKWHLAAKSLFLI